MQLHINKKRLFGVTVLGAALAVTALILMYVLPALHFPAYCMLNRAFGVQCPGCGGTHMLLAAVRGDFYQAFRYNPYLFLTLPVMGVFALYQMARYVLNLQLSAWVDNLVMYYTISLVVYGVLRNLPFLQFLQPTKL